MPYQLRIESDFSAAHRLREYRGQCERLHGHNWRVELRVAGETLGPDGLLMDFRDAKRLLADALDPLDHAYLNEVPPFDATEPSCEHLARYVAETVAAGLPAGVRVAGVTVWESARCAATYVPEGAAGADAADEEDA